MERRRATGRCGTIDDFSCIFALNRGASRARWTAPFRGVRDTGETTGGLKPSDVAGAPESHLRHPRLERRRLQAEAVSGATHTADPPACTLEDAADVVLLDIGELRAAPRRARRRLRR